MNSAPHKYPPIMAPAPADRPVPKAIERFFIWGGFVLWAGVFAPVMIGLAQEWYHDGNYSHGFFIPLISGWLIWKKRRRLTELYSVNGNWAGLIPLAAGLILFVLANAAAEFFSLRLSLVITLAGLIWLLCGRRCAGHIWFELAFLLFMIPLPYVIYYALTFPMQLFSTFSTVSILQFLGVTAIQQGNIIHLPGYSLEVAEACSGLRSLISLLALGALFARLTQQGISRQIVLFLSTIPIAIAANIFRISFTALGAIAISRYLADKFLHELSGLLVFAVAFIMLFVWGAILRRVTKNQESEKSEGANAPSKSGSVKRSPLQQAELKKDSSATSPTVSDGRSSLAKWVIASAFFILFGGAGTGVRHLQVSASGAPAFEQIPFEVAGYAGSEERFDAYQYDILKADTTTLRRYQNGAGESIWLFVAYFSSQEYGSQIHSPRHCLPGSGYDILSLKSSEIAIAEGKILTANLLLLGNEKRRELMIYWFETRAGVITTEFGLKTDLMKNALMFRPTDAAIVRVTMPLDAGADFSGGTEKASAFIQELYPTIKRALPFVK